MNLEQIWDISEKTFFIQQNKKEWMYILKILEKLQKEKGHLDILEIGAYDGGSTFCLANFAKSLVTIDDNIKCRFGGGIENSERSLNIIKEICKNYTYIGANSHDETTFNSVKELNLDVLYIDGDHSYEGAKQDFKVYKELMKEGGVIILHDIKKTPLHIQLGCRVDILWEEIKEQYPNTDEIMEEKNCFGIGIIYL